MSRLFFLVAGLLVAASTAAVAQPRSASPSPTEQASDKNPGVATAVAVPGGGHVSF